MLPECTAKAVIHRVNNIKIKAKEADMAAVEGTGPAAKATTPKRRKKAEHDEEESPTKKPKAAGRKTQAKVSVKVESVDDKQPKVEEVTDSDE